jgi:hypothetical protein
MGLFAVVCQPAPDVRYFAYVRPTTTAYWGRMTLLDIIAFGSCGGAIVQVVASSADIQAWQEARRKATAAGASKPKLSKYVDIQADALVLLTRLALGAAVGWIFHDQITGATAAVAAGASAPALLRSLGTGRSISDVDDFENRNPIEEIPAGSNRQLSSPSDGGSE